MGPNFMDLSRRDATLAAARTHVPDRVAPRWKEHTHDAPTTRS